MALHWTQTRSSSNTREPCSIELLQLAGTLRALHLFIPISYFYLTLVLIVCHLLTCFNICNFKFLPLDIVPIPLSLQRVNYLPCIYLRPSTYLRELSTRFIAISWRTRYRNFGFVRLPCFIHDEERRRTEERRARCLIEPNGLFPATLRKSGRPKSSKPISSVRRRPNASRKCGESVKPPWRALIIEWKDSRSTTIDSGWCTTVPPCSDGSGAKETRHGVICVIREL